MNQSESIGELFAALATVQAKIRAAGKNATNPHLRNRYADLGSVWDTWQEHGPAAGLAIVQAPTPDGTLRTILGHSSGQWIASETPIKTSPGKGVNDAQAYGSALTYARRYALAAIAGIYAGDDDDGAGAGNGNGNGNHRAAPAITAEQAKHIRDMIAEASADQDAFLGWLGAASVDAIPAGAYDRSVKALQAKIDKAAQS